MFRFSIEPQRLFKKIMTSPLNSDGGDLSPKKRTTVRMRFPDNILSRRSQHEEAIQRRADYSGD
ncbi:MAG: hypothetical protein DRQ54_10220, partial [Gammaproteobacteria bacterium]